MCGRVARLLVSAVALDREGVPYDTFVAHSRRAALAKFERTFGIRRLSDFTAPSPAYGLHVVGGLSQDGRTGTLTPAGLAAFPCERSYPGLDDVFLGDDRRGLIRTRVRTGAPLARRGVLRASRGHGGHKADSAVQHTGQPAVSVAP